MPIHWRATTIFLSTHGYRRSRQAATQDRCSALGCCARERRLSDAAGRQVQLPLRAVAAAITLHCSQGGTGGGEVVICCGYRVSFC